MISCDPFCSRMELWGCGAWMVSLRQDEATRQEELLWKGRKTIFLDVYCEESSVFGFNYFERIQFR